MRCSLLAMHQLPRPWAPGDEQRMLEEALAQAELADRLGFHGLWAVEHQLLEEASHASAPEVLLGAAAQRTSTLRLGLGQLLAPGFDHPARVAARAATLDLLSGGRVELATREAASGAELGGFAVARETQHEQWDEALAVLARMLVEEPFAGHDGPYLSVPPRNVVPKPAQRPHPPLWVTGTRRETVRVAARHGMGVLGLGFVEPEQARAWVDEYEELMASERCVPAGFAVNANVAVALPMLVHPDEAEAIDRGIDGAHFLGYALGHYETFGRHRPGRTSIWDEFQARRDDVGFARSAVAADGAPLSVKVMRSGLGALRGAIGTPDQVRELVGRYEAAGVDELVLVVPARDDHAREALELFAAEVLPGLAERHPAREAEKAQRLAGAMAAAIDRREPPRVADPAYAFGPRDGADADAGAVGAVADLAERLAAPSAAGIDAVRRALHDVGPPDEHEGRARRALRNIARFAALPPDEEDEGAAPAPDAPIPDASAPDAPAPAAAAVRAPADAGAAASAAPGASSASAAPATPGASSASGAAAPATPGSASASGPAAPATPGAASASASAAPATPGASSATRPAAPPSGAASASGPAAPPSGAGPSAPEDADLSAGEDRKPWRRFFEERGEEAFRAIVRRSDDARLERTVGSTAGLKFLFNGMAGRYVPEAAGGFTGDLQYDLRTSAGERRTFTVSVDPQHATARSGPAADPALVLSLTVADFLRIAAGELDPGAALLGGRMEMRGDFSVALRLSEMFGRSAP